MPEDKNGIRLADPKELLRQYQSGTIDFEEPKIDAYKPKPSAVNLMPQPGVEQPEQEEQPFDYSQFLRQAGVQNTMQEDYTREAKEAGYGLSRYDSDYAPGMDLEQNRALEQSNFAKIGSGILKGGVTAATTAVNTTLGTIFGAGAAMYELAADADGDGRGLMDTIDAGTNNWLSNQLVKIQNWAEEALPNYRTQEERSEQYQKEWYKHMGTANFIGDSILKNFGFTVGAMVGGVAWARLIGAGLSAKVANDIMKGAVVAAEGDAETSAILKEAVAALQNGAKTAEAQAAVGRAIEAVQRGTAVGIDTEKILKNLELAGKSINKMNAKLQLYGAAVGAMGEGTVEGIMAKNEFLEEYKGNLQRRYANEYNNAERDILNSGNYDWITFDAQEGPDGKLDYQPRLTKKGQEELARRQQEAIERYQQLSEQADVEADRLASTTFLLNLPILTTSNLVQFGRMFSGGWKTSRSAIADGIKGGLKELANGMVQGDYRAVGNVAGKTILNSLKVMGSESFEEMAQGTVSSGAKRVASDNLAEFNNSGYDAQATGQARDWFYSMYTGGKEYLGDIKNWQEGALGALTGLFGIPGRHWSGGVVGAYQEAKDEMDARRTTAANLNAAVNSKEFQDRWRGYIRHQAADNAMNDALKKDDEYAWHSENDKQLIGDIMMFADAGRLADLEAIVDVYASMSDDDAKANGVVDVASGQQNAKQAKNDPDKIVKNVKEQAKAVKDKIEQYKNVYEALKARAPLDASDDFLKEMTYTALQIKSFDERFLTMFGEVMEGIDPLLLASSARDENGKLLNEEESAAKYQQLRNTFERIFGSVIPVGLKQQMIDELNLEQLEKQVKDIPELAKKVKDMRKLAQDRKDYFKKLQTLQGPEGQKKFEEKAVTPGKVEQAAEEAQARIDTNGLDTFAKVKQAYLEKNAKDRADFLTSLSSVENTNPAVAQFMKLKRKSDGFKRYIEDKKNAIAGAAGLMPTAVDNFVDDFIRRAGSEDDLASLPDNMFPTFDEFSRDNRTIFGAPSAAMYDALKNGIRKAMSDYMALENGTASRNTISPTPVTPNPAPGTVVAPENTLDPAQSASVQPAPAANPAPAAQPEPEPAPEPQPEEETVIVPVTETPAPEEVAGDAIDAYQDDTPLEAETEVIPSNGGKNMIAFLRTSIPEVATEEARKGRAAYRRGSRQEMMDVDLSDFLVSLDNKISKTKKAISDIDEKIKSASGQEKTLLKKEKQNLEGELAKAQKDRKGFEETWNALNDRQAFDNIANVLEVGDEIEFVVDPTFPPYDGHYQILVTTVKNGQRYVLNVLSGQTSMYYGLYELRRAIDAEYQKHISANPNTLFVFSKKSHVWSKRDGLVDYDYNRTGGNYSEEKGIQDIRGYNADMPVAFINRNGDAMVINGKDKQAVDRVSDDFNDPAKNRDEKKVGNLYYLSYVGNGRYAPIRLWVEHFRPGNKDNDNPVFNRIRKACERIANLTKSATEGNFGEQHSKMQDALKDLSGLLNIGGYNFQIGNFGGDIGVALRIFPANDSQDNTYRRADQITPEWLVDHIASLGLSLQIKQDENGNMPNYNEYVAAGLITSNAKMMRPKGMDFYMYAWDGKEFSPTAIQKGLMEDTTKEKTYEKPKENEPVGETPAPDVKDVNVKFGRNDFGKFAEKAAESPALETPVKVAREGVDEQADAFNEHGKEIAEKFIDPKYDDLVDATVLDVAHVVTMMASQGGSRYSALVKMLSGYGEQNKPIDNKLESWGLLFNSIFSADEKKKIAEALERMYGTTADDVNLYVLMDRYNNYRNDPAAAETDDEEIVFNAFNRMITMEQNAGVIADVITPAYSYLGMKDDSFDAGNKIGRMPNFELWSDIPERIQDILKEKGYTQEEYEKNMTAPARIQVLNCAPVG